VWLEILALPMAPLVRKLRKRAAKPSPDRFDLAVLAKVPKSKVQTAVEKLDLQDWVNPVKGKYCVDYGITKLLTTPEGFMRVKWAWELARDNKAGEQVQTLAAKTWDVAMLATYNKSPGKALVYLIRFTNPDWFKVGKFVVGSRASLMHRFNGKDLKSARLEHQTHPPELAGQMGPGDITVLATMEGGVKKERELHSLLKLACGRKNVGEFYPTSVLRLARTLFAGPAVDAGVQTD